MAFCGTGLRILARDIVEVGGLIRACWAGGRMGSADWALVRRVVSDCVALVPYTIIMIIPLSPPGHVFAFSLLNRVFPGAVPSGFTAQRQDINELYARIAAEATDKPLGSPARRLMRSPANLAKRAVRLVRSRVGVEAARVAAAATPTAPPAPPLPQEPASA